MRRHDAPALRQAVHGDAGDWQRDYERTEANDRHERLQNAEKRREAG